MDFQNPMQMKWTLFFNIILITLIQSCSSNVSTEITLDELPTTLQALVDEGIIDSFNDVPGVSMSIMVPDLDLDWSGASGHDSRVLDNPLSADQPFRIASVTKTFVAAAILRLHESGKLSVDESIEHYISESNKNLLLADGYSVSDITIRSCLNHTCGLFDYALGGRAYMEAISKSPNRRWTREDQLKFAMDFGEPLGEVGKRYVYNDTGYILLGEIIERQVDSTLAYGLRTLLSFDQLNMKNTWLESLEPAPDEHMSVVHRYYRKQDYTAWDPSIDLWGGGGLVSTTRDLCIFFNALFNNKIFDNDSTLDLMLEGANIHPDNMDDRYEDYRLGVWNEKMYDMSCFVHYGLWDTYAMHIPELNCTVAVNYTDGGRERLMKKAVLVIKNILDNQSKN